MTDKALPTQGMVMIAALLLLGGCSPVQQKIDAEGAAATASKLSYFKDSHGICYAEISSYSYGFNTVVSIATVPCDKVAL